MTSLDLRANAVTDHASLYDLRRAARRWVAARLARLQHYDLKGEIQQEERYSANELEEHLVFLFSDAIPTGQHIRPQTAVVIAGRGIKVVEDLIAVMPANWDQKDDDPEQFRAWKAALDFLRIAQRERFVAAVEEGLA